jgi:hypothetical protein
MNQITYIQEQIKKRISSKTAPSSISRIDVADLLNMVLDATAVPLLSSQNEYGLGYLGKDTSNNLYISIQPNVNGDWTNNANWKKISDTTVDGNVFEETITISTNGQTTFNLSGIPLDANKVEIYLNGQRLKMGIDFTATSLGVLNYYGDVRLLTRMNLTAIYRT